jgi:hypothetical protein
LVLLLLLLILKRLMMKLGSKFPYLLLETLLRGWEDHWRERGREHRGWVGHWRRGGERRWTGIRRGWRWQKRGHVLRGGKRRRKCVLMKEESIRIRKNRLFGNVWKGALGYNNLGQIHDHGFQSVES